MAFENFEESSLTAEKNGDNTEKAYSFEIFSAYPFVLSAAPR
jgi:hypothetical protein